MTMEITVMLQRAVSYIDCNLVRPFKHILSPLDMYADNFLVLTKHQLLHA